MACAILAAISAFLLFSASAFSASFAFLAASFFAVSSSFTVGFFGTGCFCDDLFFFFIDFCGSLLNIAFPSALFLKLVSRALFSLRSSLLSSSKQKAKR